MAGQGPGRCWHTVPHHSEPKKKKKIFEGTESGKGSTGVPAVTGAVPAAERHVRPVRGNPPPGVTVHFF